MINNQKELQVNNTCPFCLSQSYEEITYSSEFIINKEVVNIEGLKKNHCSECKGESVSMEQYKNNFRLYVQRKLRCSLSKDVLDKLYEYKIIRPDIEERFGTDVFTWDFGDYKVKLIVFPQDTPESVLKFVIYPDDPALNSASTSWKFSDPIPQAIVDLLK